MSKYRTRLIVVAVILLGVFSILWLRRSSLVVVPVGKVTGSDGITRFVIGITNRSGLAWSCVTGNMMVATNAAGLATTNLTPHQEIRVEPRSGVQIAIVAPTNQAVWTVMVGFLRETGPVEERLRLDAVRHGLNFSKI